MSRRQTLFLLRHAEAQPWLPGVTDLERSLSEQGRQHMEQLSSWAEKKLERPELVLCSTALRTRQTLEPLLGRWVRAGTRIRYREEMYEATTGRLQRLVEKGFASVDRLLLVGHNPGLGYLSQAIAAASDDNQPGTMAAGSLAVFEFDRGWSGHEHDGHIAHWINRAQFD